MSQAATPSNVDKDHGHDHDPHLAHHFHSRDQQMGSEKLGMWVFLATEILMFSGLFVAYAVYRGNHPELFHDASGLLSTKWGAINTVILISSSFTMAWAVRATQLNQRKLATILLSLTLLGGFGFMGIKYVEYSEKLYKGIGPGPLWNEEKLVEAIEKKHGKHATDMPAVVHDEGEVEVPTTDARGQAALHDDAVVTPADGPEPSPPPARETDASIEPRQLETAEQDVPAAPEVNTDYVTAIPPPGEPITGLAVETGESKEYTVVRGEWLPSSLEEARRLRSFVDIYYSATGLHGIHVLIGMGLIAWILIRNHAGHFNARYYMPVDLVGLYWHLVDLVWIFLFPLLYLIE